jgi:hypothetical protein
MNFRASLLFLSRASLPKDYRASTTNHSFRLTLGMCSLFECRRLDNMPLVTGFIFYDILLWTFVVVLAATAHYFRTHSR